MTGTFIDRYDNVLGCALVRSGKFSFLSGRDLHVVGDRLVHKVMVDGDRSVFDIFGLDEDPRISCGIFLCVAVHGEHVLDLFCIVEDLGGRMSKK